VPEILAEIQYTTEGAHIDVLAFSGTLAIDLPLYKLPIYICSSFHLHGRNNLRPIPSSDHCVVREAIPKGIRHKHDHALTKARPSKGRPTFFFILEQISPISSIESLMKS
jgi:hypothetical protein